MPFPVGFEIIRTVLSQRIGVRCMTDVPEKRPSRFITIQSASTGTPYRGVVQRVLTKRRFIVYCWGSDEVDAAEMAEDALDFLLQLPELRLGARRVDVVGTPSERDYIVGEQKVHDRYVFTVDVTLRANP
jgi:hypothetical protein